MRVPPTVLLALAGTMVAAAAVAALVVALVFSAQAGSIGERVGAAAGEELARAQADQMEQMMGGYPGWDTGGPLPPVEESEPVPPGELGPDPVLDRYAQDCFTGDLQACDDLFFQSAPYSEYERYGSTCGGRVKPLQVPFCTDLD